MKEAVDRIVNEVYTLQKDIGLIVGITAQGMHNTFGYGEKKGEGSRESDVNTIFEIGSITKVFTTSILSILVSEDRLSLDTPVCDIYSILPDFPSEITLRRLATHTSGLPKMPPNALLKAFKNRSNPYVAYTNNMLIDYLSNYKKPPKIDEKINYSNVGLALLGQIIAKVTQSNYEGAVVDTICNELNMNDTRVNLKQDQIERLATPHSGGGRVVSGWDLPAFTGAGALYSTANDMLRFLDAHLGTYKSSLKDALLLSHTRQTSKFQEPSLLVKLILKTLKWDVGNPNFKQGIGLGWMIGNSKEKNYEVHWHHGATGGYIAFTGFVREAGVGIIVLSNRGPRFSEMISGFSIVDEIGYRILEHICSK